MKGKVVENSKFNMNFQFQLPFLDTTHSYLYVRNEQLVTYNDDEYMYVMIVTWSQQLAMLPVICEPILPFVPMIIIQMLAAWEYEDKFKNKGIMRTKQLKVLKID